MQADAIPDWAVYIVMSPFFPLGFAVHQILGITQCITLLILIGWAIIRHMRKNNSLIKQLFEAYLITIIIPNIFVVFWGVITDPCL